MKLGAEAMSRAMRDRVWTRAVTEEGTGSENTITLGNMFIYRGPCNGCSNDPNVLTRDVQSKWQKQLPVPQNSILFTVYRSEEVDQLISNLESNIANLSNMNDALTDRIKQLSKDVQELKSNQAKH
jgi:hypothetical protein